MKYPKRSQYKYAKSPYPIRNWPAYEETAKRHYASFIARWRDADPRLQPEVDAIKQRLSDLVGERRR